MGTHKPASQNHSAILRQGNAHVLSPCPLQGSDWVVLERSEQSHVTNHLDSTEAEVRIYSYMYLFNDNNAQGVWESCYMHDSIVL